MKTLNSVAWDDKERMNLEAAKASKFIFFKFQSIKFKKLLTNFVHTNCTVKFAQIYIRKNLSARFQQVRVDRSIRTKRK